MKFGPRVSKDFICAGCNLTSLEFCHEEVGYTFKCSNNPITSLEFGPTKIGVDLIAGNINIVNLKNIHKHFKNGYIGRLLDLKNNDLKSHLLGIILIPKLQYVNLDKKAMHDILNIHLKTRDVLECQEELIQNGLKEFAQL